MVAAQAPEPPAAELPLVDTVTLLGYPVPLGMWQAEHFAELLREFALIVISEGAGSGRAQVPQRLIDLADAITTRYSDELSGPTAALEQAAQAGQATVDLHYPVVPETKQVIRAWEAVMAEVDEFCRAGSLLTLATPPEIVALRRWTLEQFLDQVEGRPARGWPGESVPS
ncbi:MAG: hypothetical protein M3Z02_01775 [Actinomycetota bacterium]|nr:hypothetical protein [Actinomycetota bacterium]